MRKFIVQINSFGWLQPKTIHYKNSAMNNVNVANAVVCMLAGYDYVGTTVVCLNDEVREEEEEAMQI